jgi:hypothetical protein
MDLPIVVVVGALGAQGAGVVAALTAFDQPRYQIRALTSNASSEAAVALAIKAHVSVEAVDLDSIESIVSAFRDASYIFGNTVFHPETFMTKGPQAAQDRESGHGLNLARAASQIPTLRHYVWSTLTDALKVAGPEYDIPHLQSKIPADNYIKSDESGLAGKTTFLRLGLYGTNCNRPPYCLVPVASSSLTRATSKVTDTIVQEAAGKHVMALPCPGDALVPFVGDERANTGALVRAIIEQPEKTFGRVVVAAEMISCRDWVKAIEKSLRKQGKEINAVYLDCSLEAFEQLWGPIGTEIGLMMKLFGEVADGMTADAGPLPALNARDLGIEGQMRSTEDTIADMDWQTLI